MKQQLRPLLASALACLFALNATPALAQTCSAPVFRQPPIYPVGTDTRAVAAADFDGDGRPDLAITDVNSNSVTVLTRVARDVPAVSNAYTVGRFPLAAATGDFNNDGKQDLVVGNNSGFSVTLLVNDGAGRFLPGVEFPAGGQLSSIAVGDINSDNKLDLIIAEEFGFKVVTMLGDGQGGFGAAINVISLQQPRLAITADFNADGKLDIAVASFEGTRILLGNGLGAFTAQPSTCAQGFAFGLAAGDVNGDGKQDLATSDVLGNSAGVMLGNGSGCFGAQTSLPNGGSYDIALADLNSDGKLDIIQGSLVRLGDGAGGFGSPNRYGNGSSGSNTVVADFDADGKPDIASAGSGTAGILFGDGMGGFRFALGPSGAGAYGLARADFNSDGKPDLVLTTNPNITLLTGDGAGNFSKPSNSPLPFFPTGGPSVADFNRDGKLDVAVIDTSHTGPGGAPRLCVLLGNGAGGFSSPVLTIVTDNDPVELSAGDFNNDTKPDLLLLSRTGGFNGSGSAFVALGDGTGQFTQQPRFSVNVTSNPKAPAIADFNSDGKLDAAVPSGGGFSIVLGNGAGGFGQPVNYISANAASIAVSDFNNDGKQDLALTPDSQQNGKVAVVLGDGAGGFGLATSYAVGFFPSDVTAADLNGDGKQDLAVTSSMTSDVFTTSSIVSVLLGDGAGKFGPASTLTVDRGPRRIIAGDFNADGLNDLVTANGVNNISVLLNSCGASSEGPSTFQFGAPLYTVGEGAGSLIVTVTRAGNTSGPASVRYATNDGTASSRSDYIAALGTLRFADGESAKTFNVLVIDDAKAGEGEESLRLTLSDPVGASLGGTTSAVVAIRENDPSITNVNPIDSSQFFVRQHYLDFLNREPDTAGLNFWVGEIEKCGTDAQCREVKRINVSAAFFLSIEFQETGFLVERVYKTAYGDTTSTGVQGPVPGIRLNEFLEDSQGIGRGIIVGQGPWEQQLEANKQAYALEFVQRQRFTDAYPLTLTAAQFVAKLNQNAGSALTQAEADQVASTLNAQGSGTAQGRAAALRAVAEHAVFRQRETGRAFVLMQYYGYLRRNPDDAPEAGRNFAGWRFWLDKLEQFGGNYINAEMVKAFITSTEYRQRFL